MKNAAPVLNRGPYQGVVQILQFNWRAYAGTLVVAAGGLLALPYLPMRGFVAAGLFAAIYWMCASLAVSHYVYDRYRLYDLAWIARALSHLPRRWVNIHAGLDETSELIAGVFPSSEGRTWDIYDPSEMTEPSIEEARRSRPESLHADWRALPAGDATLDAAFLIFAAHELRRPESRARFFQELARVLRPGGEVVLVEHLRDWPNYLAFGPGFLHFFRAAAWREAAVAARLEVHAELTKTPFVHVFILRRPL
jgi:SAM-dependent methyltransferase